MNKNVIILIDIFEFKTIYKLDFLPNIHNIGFINNCIIMDDMNLGDIIWIHIHSYNMNADDLNYINNICMNMSHLKLSNIYYYL